MPGNGQAIKRARPRGGQEVNRSDPVMSGHRSYGPQFARSDSRELTAEDYDSLDDATFEDFCAWDSRRTRGNTVAYHLGDYSMPEVFAWLRWLKCKVITLNQRLRESKSAKRMRELEKDRDDAIRLLEKRSEIVSVESMHDLRAKNEALRLELAACQRTMRAWQITPPKGRK